MSQAVDIKGLKVLAAKLDGAEHEMTLRCRRFANQLHGRFNLPVELVDERYSSAVIDAKRGEHIDDKAAAIILQQYFDSRH